MGDQNCRHVVGSFDCDCCRLFFSNFMIGKSCFVLSAEKMGHRVESHA